MLSRSKQFLVLFLALALGAGRASSGEVSPSIRYNRDIRPIFAENCLLCHGPDNNRRKAKLRLDVRDSALDRKAIVPGKPEDSLLVQHIFTTNANDIMPPPSTHKALTAEEKKALKDWIAQGAQYEKHWAYIQPVRPAVPAVRETSMVREAIDAFTL